LPAVPGDAPLKPLAAMLDLAPKTIEKPSAFRQNRGRMRRGEKRGRVAILTGCAQPVLKPGINEATIRLLNRVGVEVVVPEGEGCCGALVHHMGREEQALDAARRNVDAWMRQIDRAGSTPSSSPHRAAAPPSRTMAGCCARIRPMPTRPPVSRTLPRTSPSISPPSICPSRW
jgi:Fe-S oxidoreductase